MDTNNIIAKLIDYMEGNLTHDQVVEVEQQLQKSKEWQKAFEELNLLEDLMEKTPVAQPSPNSKKRFEALLNAEKQAVVSKPKPLQKTSFTFQLNHLLAAAATIALLMMGTGIGIQWKNNQRQQTEILALKTQMQEQKKLLALSLLEQSSASARIKGVNISLNETKKDEQILSALIDRMNLDENINVQLKAIEGIAQFNNHKKVITALIKALGKQKSPEVQIAIIEVLVGLKAKAAYPQFQEILRDKETNAVVKNKAAAGLEILL
jgi:hypothetical protein